MSKIDENKQIKRESLLDTAFRLFTSKGIHKTSISDIVEDAGVAKGTFYLYFKDKYDIRNKLIVHKSSEVFKRAGLALKATDITVLEDRVVFLVDNIINQLKEDTTLMGFIHKNLSWGVFVNAFIEAGDDSEVDFNDLYHIMFGDERQFDNPKVMVYMILELVGSTCYSAILYSEPVGIEELRPYLLRTVRAVMAMHRV